MCPRASYYKSQTKYYRNLPSRPYKLSVLRKYIENFPYNMRSTSERGYHRVQRLKVSVPIIIPAEEPSGKKKGGTFRQSSDTRDEDTKKGPKGEQESRRGGASKESRRGERENHTETFKRVRRSCSKSLSSKATPAGARYLARKPPPFSSVSDKETVRGETSITLVSSHRYVPIFKLRFRRPALSRIT